MKNIFVIKNLKAIISGHGFLKSDGRFPKAEQLSLISAPADIAFDRETGKILYAGPSKVFEEAHAEFDGSGLTATPGFIDGHTHSLFSGTRAQEYFNRWAGLSYKEISDAGGGIHNTFQAIKNSTDQELEFELFTRLQRFKSTGTTTVEVKSGYADTPEGELRLLRIIGNVASNMRCPINVKKTFLPLHALPKGQNEKSFVDQMIAILPEVKKNGLADFVDAFPEKGFFSLEESLRFASAAKDLGLLSKVHADELSPMTCVESVVPLGALSVDHLQKISPAGVEALVKKQTVAAFLPATSFFLDLEYAPARKLVDAGARVSLATDFNPGTAPDADLRFTARLAASKMKLNATEIFCALTYNAAASLGLEGSKGILQNGFDADICLWKLGSDSKDTSAQALLEELFVESPAPHQVFVGGI
ncbi:imidazolonepropionase [bacterium]|nr:imidazolonepropionase [bacterium]